MEDVLEVYQRPHDAKRPVICLDETSRQLAGETRTPRPARPGQPAVCGYEVADLFMLFEPLAGRREVRVTESRTRKDFACCLRELAEQQYPGAEQIVLVMDNLNTRTLSSLYAAFPPAAARRLYERFEVHRTPKHASWLNMAEIEIGVAGRQCLDRRIGDIQTLKREVAARVRERNGAKGTVRWHFTASDARVKLQHLYPKI